MDRRASIRSLTGSLLVVPLTAEAQQAGKVYRVGYPSAPSRESVVEFRTKE